MSVNNVTVSIIVPIYNTEQYLGQCLDSLINQTLANIELILVDDGSTDNSLAICNYYADRYKQINVLPIQHSGVAIAQQTGLEAAKGKYVTFFGADDYASPEMYQKMYDEAEKINADIVECEHCLFWEDGARIDSNKQYIAGRLKKHKYSFLHSGAEAVFRNIGYAWRIHKRDFLLNNSFYFDKNIAFGEDFIWHFFPIALSEKYSIINHTGYFYRQRLAGNQSNSSEEKLLDIIKAFDQADFFLVKLPHRYLLKHYIQYEIRIAIYILRKLTGDNRANFYNMLHNRWQKWNTISCLPNFTSTGLFKIDAVEYMLGTMRIYFLKNVVKCNFKKAEHISNLITDLGSGGALKKTFNMIFKS